MPTAYDQATIPTAYDQAISFITNDIQRSKKELERLYNAEPVLRALEATLHPAYIYVGTNIEFICYHLDQPGFTAESNPELLTCLEHIEATLHQAEITTHDLPEENARLYIFTAGDIQVRLTAYLATDAATCTRQIVGYKEVTEERTVSVTTVKPIYKFTC